MIYIIKDSANKNTCEIVRRESQFGRVNIVGFDVEYDRWGTPALIQVHSSKNTYLFQIYHMEYLSLALQEIISSPEWIKFGVNVTGDLKALSKYYPIKYDGCCDLGLISKNLNGSNSLSGLYNLYCGEFTKQRHCGDWARLELTDDQIKYAADDAVKSYELGMKMIGYPLLKTHLKTTVKKVRERWYVPYQGRFYSGDSEEAALDNVVMFIINGRRAREIPDFIKKIKNDIFLYRENELVKIRLTM